MVRDTTDQILEYLHLYQKPVSDMPHLVPRQASWLLLALLAREVNGMLDFLTDLTGPRQGPISVARANYAVPVHPTLRTLNEVPPVYEIPGFLSEAECEGLISAALSGCDMPPVPYGQKNKIFTGTKWAAGNSGAADPFFQKACALWDVPETRFEPVTVTRYNSGEFQAKHLDARLPHEVRRTAAYLASGGQRIAQVIVYLQPPTSGGGTKFFGPSFGGLEVQPEMGKALVFPTATLDGLADERYLHSGEPVRGGSKWIIGTWLLEKERTDGADVNAAINELWKLARRS